MTTDSPARADLRRARAMLALVIAGLAASGATAVPLRWGAELLAGLAGPGSALQPLWPAMAAWLGQIREAVAVADARYPLLFYGTDWLAFAHIVIALAFVGPLRDPVRNVWVIEWGMLACALVPPTAFVFGPLRGIPFFWQLIDCSFGALGFLPLYAAWRAARRAERALASAPAR